MEKLYSAGIVLFSQENSKIKYLLLHYCDGHWGFPKGQIEERETKQQAAHRELYEETGLQVTIKPGFETITSYIFNDKTSKKVHKTVYFFIGQLKEKKEIILSHEHKNFIWLPFDSALKQLTYDNTKKILQEANHYLLSLPSLPDLD